MHPQRRIEEIRSTADGEITASAIRRAAKHIETSTPIGAVLATVAAEEFIPALIEVAEDRSPREERAWLTLAAAGAERARLSLAWRASGLLDPEEIVEVFISHRRDLREECERRADRAVNDDAQGAWLLLSWLKAGQLRRLVRGRPRLFACYRKARATSAEGRRRQGAGRKTAPRRRGRINPQIAAQLHALGLV